MGALAIVFPPLRVSRDFIDYPYFADLGAVQAAAVVRGAGFEPALVDALAMEGATLTPLDDGYVQLGVTADAVIDRVPADAAAILVAFTPFHRPPARDPLLAEVLVGLRAGHPRTPILLADLYQSGQHVVDAQPSATLAAYPEVDVFVRYEAEALLAALLTERIAEGRPEIPYFLDGGEPSPLDDLPLPAWDLVDLEAYFRFHEAVIAGLGRPSWAFPIAGRSAPVLTSRGCPYRCVHCSSNPTTRRDGKLVAPKTQRRYSPAYLDRLFADLRARGVRRVHLIDELVNVNERHFDAVMELLEKHDLGFEIPNGMRADYILPAHFATMRERMTTLSVSAESGVQRVVTEIIKK
ncbi:MAG: radical SAM protein, partial [Byssovorax sp.]